MSSDIDLVLQELKIQCEKVSRERMEEIEDCDYVDHRRDDASLGLKYYETRSKRRRCAMEMELIQQYPPPPNH